MAMDIISKDKKEIQWRGLPRTSLNDIEELKVSIYPFLLDKCRGKMIGRVIGQKTKLFQISIYYINKQCVKLII